MKKIFCLLVMLVCFSSPAMAAACDGVFAPGQFCASVNGGFPQAVTPVPAILGTMALQSSNGVAITGGTITGLPSPSNASDAATKQYVDNTSAGLVVHTQAVLATAAALPANTYNNGASGVGATLTGTGFGALSVDGTAVSVSQRIVVKNESTAANNGIYSVTTVGDGSHLYVLTRTTDANQPGTGSINLIGFGTYVFVTSGTANASTSWSVNSTVSTIGTSAINWVQFSASANTTVSNSDGTLTISPTSGNIVASLSTTQPHANTWTATQTVKIANGIGLALDTPSTSQANYLQLLSNAVGKWQIGKDASDNFQIFDTARGNFDLTIASNGNAKLMPNGGSATIGNGFFADNSGHPYCDVRAFGAGGGTPSVDQTDIAAALSACAGGVVFFSCGAYGNTATWTVPASTEVKFASRGCASITTTQTAGSVFVCATGTSGPTPIVFDGVAIYGVGATTGGSVPTAGYAIDCGSGGNQQTFYGVYVNGTYNGVNIGGTNGRFRDGRIEGLYGTIMINELAGGNTIEGNQFDNNSEFNATGGGGFGTLITYNTSSPVSVTTGTIATSSGRLFVATVGGTTAPLGGGIPSTVMYKNITDGGVTWQFIGSASLILIVPGTETWIIDNDMTSPANIAIDLDGNNSANRNWIIGDDCAGEISGCVVLVNTAELNNIAHNQMFNIGYNLSGVITGFPIWDQTPAGASTGEFFTNISGNTIEANDAAIIWQGDYSTINGNTISNGAVTHQFCGITTSGTSGHPIGTGIVGNFINGGAPGAICMDGSSGTRTTVVGNSVLGGTISLVGTNIVNVGNN